MNGTMNRRAFLQRVGYLSAGAAASQLMSTAVHAQANDYKALVCVFLFGGNDGNNVIVPIDSRYSAYAALRGSLALSQSDVLPLTDHNGALEFGLHPALASLRSAAWANGHLAVLMNAGPLNRPVTRAEVVAGSRPAGLFSHFDQQHAWQTGRASANRGWGGRIADEMTARNGGATAPTMIAIANEATFANARSGALVLPPSGGLVLRGMDSTAASQARAQAMQQMLTLDKQFELVAAAQDVTSEVLERRAAINAVLNATSSVVRTAFSGTSSNVAQQLSTIAKLIERHATLGIHRQVFFVGVGGFDTHSGQLATQNALLTQVGVALKSFYNATSAMGLADRVTTFTLSDFARTIRVNTVGGTDHAWGNHHLILGGAVRGRAFYGSFPELAVGGPDDAGDDGRWIPTTSVEQYAATLGSWFGVPDARLTELFPTLTNFANKTLPFMS